MAVTTEVALSDRLRRYLEAWHALDPVAVKNLYAEDGTHRGPGVVMFYPGDADPTLKGNDAIAEFAARMRDALGGSAISEFVVTWTLEAGSTSVLEYDMRSEDRAQRWAEIVEWDGTRVHQVHAYILASAG